MYNKINLSFLIYLSLAEFYMELFFLCAVLFFAPHSEFNQSDRGEYLETQQDTPADGLGVMGQYPQIVIGPNYTTINGAEVQDVSEFKDILETLDVEHVAVRLDDERTNTYLDTIRKHAQIHLNVRTKYVPPARRTYHTGGEYK